MPASSSELLALRQKQKHLQALLSSRGWAILNEIMRDEIVEAGMAIANSPSMTLDEINFRRGSIWAAKQLINLPGKALARVEGDLALAAPPPSNPATAGEE